MPEAMNVFTHRFRTADGFIAEISSRAAPRTVEDLAGRVGFLMISIKNRLFTSALIRAYCRFATEHLAAGCVTVVDRPYIHNVAAVSHDPSANARQMNGIRRLGEDRRQQAQKIIDNYDRGRIEFISWDDLAAQTPRWLEAEFRTAFENRGQLHSDLLEQTSRMSGESCDQATLERRALFLVEETPALLYSYYLFRGGIADFYPGELASYFWRIERGDYAEELPRTTELAATHQGLLYVTFRDGRR
jgi:hypothetical protein